MKNLLYTLVLCILAVNSAAKADVIDVSGDLPLRGAYLVVQPEAQFVTVQLLLDVGEADNLGPEGLSHYLEHLVWYSADKAHGNTAKNRIANAWASVFFTNYWNASDPAKLDDMLAASAAVFAPIDLQPSFSLFERNIVAREFDLSFLDRPNRQLYNAMNKALLPKNAASRSVIGTRESIAAITPEAASAFKNKWYSPRNARLLISGPITAATLTPLLQKHFADLPAGPQTERTAIKTPNWDGRKVDATLTHPKLNAPVFSVLLKAPAPAGLSQLELNQTLNILGELLNSSTEDSPRKALYYDDFILSSIDVAAWWDQTNAINLAFTGVADPDVPLEDAIAATVAFFDGIKGVNTTSFAKVKTKAIDSFQREMDSPDVSRNIALSGLLEGDVPYSTDAVLRELQAVSVQNVNTLLKAFQTKGISVTGIAYPEE